MPKTLAGLVRPVNRSPTSDHIWYQYLDSSCLSSRCIPDQLWTHTLSLPILASSASHATHMKAALALTQRHACTWPAPRCITAATSGTAALCRLRCRGLLDGFLGGGNCRTCKGKGAITCPECKGVGRNKKQGGGNIFERYKCYNCQGFGQVQCPKCGKAGLTPEQRGER